MTAVAYYVSNFYTSAYMGLLALAHAAAHSSEATNVFRQFHEELFGKVKQTPEVAGEIADEELEELIKEVEALSEKLEEAENAEPTGTDS